ECAAGVDPGDASVKRVRTGLNDLVEDGASGATVFGTEVRGLDVDFLDCVRVGDGVCGSGYGDVVVLDTVNHEVVTAWTLAVDGEHHGAVLVDRIAANQADAGKQLCKCQAVAGHHGQRRDGLRREILAAYLFRGLQRYFGGSGFDRYYFLRGSDL